MNTTSNQARDDQTSRLLAEYRSRQLDLARRGEYRESARFAQLASRLRSEVGEAGIALADPPAPA